jgi:hypothetical protein
LDSVKNGGREISNIKEYIFTTDINSTTLVLNVSLSQGSNVT